VKLADDEREVLLAEVAQALDQVRAPELKVRYGELLTALDAGDVPDDLLEPLQALLEVGLDTGRIRHVHTAHGEMAARRVYSRTPKGKAVRATSSAVNEALKALEGQTLEEITVSPNGPGSYSVSVATSKGRVLIILDRAGAEIKSLDVG
jgi:hypothetical protein